MPESRPSSTRYALPIYGRYPRVSAGRNEETPDPGGIAITSGDPRAILRRGAGEGFSEVDFLGRDGVGYRVRWTAYRARGRANGRLQAETRSLHRIADGAAIATGKTAVNEAVVARTDLTYDQFRRTVVLAQGEFDAFLLAGEGDRADLLEKITGTQVYTEISKRVRAGADEHRAALAVLVARRDTVGLLDAGARDAKVVERAAIDAAMPGLVAEQAYHAAALDHARSLSAAEARFTEASIQASEATAAVSGGEADAARVAELEAVERSRPMAEAVTATQDGLAAAEELLEKARAEVEAAEARLAPMRAGLASAHSADETGEGDLRTFTPTWSAADVLDARIGALVREAAAAADKATKAAADLDGARTRRTDLDRTHDGLATSRDAAAARIATDALMAPLASHAGEIAGLFAKRTAVARDRDAALAALTDARTRIAAADAATGSARERAVAARGTRARHLADRATLGEELRGLDAEAAEAGHAHLRVVLERLAVASDLVRRHGLAGIELERARGMQAKAEASRVTAAARRDAAERAHGQAGRARIEIAAVADLAERGASVEAANLRSALVAGRPCPVCGSADHPVGRDGHGPDALTDLAGTMRRRRSDIDAELARAGADIAQAAAEWADASARQETATREAAQAQASLSDAADAYAELKPGLASACIPAGMRDGPPAVPGPGAGDRLAAMTAAATAARAALAATLDRTRALSGEIRIRETAIAIADGEIAAAEEVILAEAGPRHDAALTAERERTRTEGLSERFESLVRELGPFLAAGGLDEAALVRDAEGTARRIAELGARYHEVRESHRGLVETLNDLLPRRAVAIEAEAAAARAEDGASRAAKDLTAALEEARQARARLLGGEPTDIHRARFTASRDQAREDHRMAREAVGIAAELHAAAANSAGHALDQRRRAQAALAEARGRFVASCGDRAPDAVIALLAVPPEALTALRDAQARLLRAHEAAEVALATRSTDLDGLRALPTVDVPATGAAAARVSETIAAHQRHRGALDADLARDDDARGRASDLSGKIEAAREGLLHWEAVDAAVGSPTGDRFRRFAQGVTLEHLARLANEQLRTLSPRYALVRSQGPDLALHVLDRDMGDELRGTRSLSGGERFLVALALALALSGLEGRQAFVDTLFIDEGFGSLDAETLDVAIDALETLQGQGRRVGVITHVAAMIDRIAVQVRVERRGNGRSVVRIVDGAMPG